MENTHLRITQDNPSKNILNIAAKTENCISLAIFSGHVLFNIHISFSYIFIYETFCYVCFSNILTFLVNLVYVVLKIKKTFSLKLFPPLLSGDL